MGGRRASRGDEAGSQPGHPDSSGPLEAHCKTIQKSFLQSRPCPANIKWAMICEVALMWSASQSSYSGFTSGFCTRCESYLFLLELLLTGPSQAHILSVNVGGQEGGDVVCRWCRIKCFLIECTHGWNPYLWNSKREVIEESNTFHVHKNGCYDGGDVALRAGAATIVGVVFVWMIFEPCKVVSLTPKTAKWLTKFAEWQYLRGFVLSNSCLYKNPQSPITGSKFCS